MNRPQKQGDQRLFTLGSFLWKLQEYVAQIVWLHTFIYIRQLFCINFDIIILYLYFVIFYIIFYILYYVIFWAIFSQTHLAPILPNPIFPILHIFVRFYHRYVQNFFKFVKIDSYVCTNFFQIIFSLIWPILQVFFKKLAQNVFKNTCPTSKYWQIVTHM
jgi:hypothetical protein